MKKRKETKEFKTEVKQVMSLIINSIYSNKDIFLRELISNASDAIDKIKFKSHTTPDILGDDNYFKINIDIDKKNRSITISDNGIGMSYDEVLDNIGTIAKSGTSNFVKAIEKANEKKVLVPELIGQFGVGFYSSFMVAEKVEIRTKTAEKDKNAVKWESEGDGKYIIQNTEKKLRGTSITIYLKKQEKEEKDYTDQWVIQDIVKQHSDFVNYPIMMNMEKYESIPENEVIKDKKGKPIGETTKKVIKAEILNSMKAIWNKNPNEVKKEEHEEFYKHISHDWNPHLDNIHIKFEGTTEYYALLYIPSKAPFDLFNKDRRHGINLYSKKVFIMEDCKDLIPEYFRFIKGVVDATDLNLNISREILQQDLLVKNIRKNLIKKIFDCLEKMEVNKYENFYSEFGIVIKEGIHTDPINKNKIASLIRFKTSKSNNKWVSLNEYLKNMKNKQNEIYYITGENISTIIDSPHLENLKNSDYEVLLMTDPIDEWVVQSLTEYKGKQLKNAMKGNLSFKKTDKKRKKSYNKLFKFIKNELKDSIKEVKLSERLKESISCLSGDKWDMSPYMEKLLKSSGQKTQKNKRILEINIDHPVIIKMKSISDKNPEDALLKDYSQFVFGMAIVGEGGKLENPSSFTKIVSNFINIDS